MTTEHQQQPIPTKTQVRKALQQHLAGFEDRIQALFELIQFLVSDDPETLEMKEWRTTTINDRQEMRERTEASPELLEGLVQHIANIDASLSTLEDDVKSLDTLWDDQY